MARLPEALERELSEELDMRLAGGIQNAEPIYDSDSLFIVQFEIAARDSLDHEVVMPIRYVYVYDKFMSMATGRPLFNEGFFSTRILSEDEINDLKERICIPENHMYEYFVGVTAPIPQ